MFSPLSGYKKDKSSRKSHKDIHMSKKSYEVSWYLRQNCHFLSTIRCGSSFLAIMVPQACLPCLRLFSCLEHRHCSWSLFRFRQSTGNNVSELLFLAFLSTSSSKLPFQTLLAILIQKLRVWHISRPRRSFWIKQAVGCCRRCRWWFKPPGIFNFATSMHQFVLVY